MSIWRNESFVFKRCKINYIVHCCENVEYIEYIDYIIAKMVISLSQQWYNYVLETFTILTGKIFTLISCGFTETKVFQYNTSLLNNLYLNKMLLKFLKYVLAYASFWKKYRKSVYNDIFYKWQQWVQSLEWFIWLITFNACIFNAVKLCV